MKSRLIGPFSLSTLATDIATALASFFADTVIKAELHAIASVGINASGGAFVAFASGAALAADVKRVQLSYTAGEPLDFRLGANAGAAASANTLFYLNQGDGPVDIPVAIPSGSKLWVRSASTNAVAAGYITANLMG